MNCKNCNQVIDGQFCKYCGQSTKVDRINLPNFLSELSTSVFQVNKGFFYSLKELFVRPGHSIREYLSGKRKKHFKPITYVLTLSTVYFLLTQILKGSTFINDFITGFTNASDLSEIDTKQLTILNWFAKNYAYTMLMLLPLSAFASYLAFLKTGFNYLEHFVLNAYVMGQQAIIYSFSSLLSTISPNRDLLVSATLFVSFLYVVFVFWQFFSELSRIAVILRTLLTYMLYLCLLAITVFLFFTVSQFILV